MATSAQIAPWLSVADASAAVDFYRRAFGADLIERVDDDAGQVIIAELRIAGATFWVQADPDAVAGAGGSPVRLILIVDDPDPLFARGLAAGGTEVAAMHEAHGWRTGRLADPAGLHWEVAKRAPTRIPRSAAPTPAREEDPG
ncbi:MAG TPA: VOC family protein [Kofleriaceae bacterium]|nr:VOC family protein [Kofleriaceae bacterium]